MESLTGCLLLPLLLATQLPALVWQVAERAINAISAAPLGKEVAAPAFPRCMKCRAKGWEPLGATILGSRCINFGGKFSRSGNGRGLGR